MINYNFSNIEENGAYLLSYHYDYMFCNEMKKKTVNYSEKNETTDIRRQFHNNLFQKCLGQMNIGENRFYFAVTSYCEKTFFNK